MFDEILKWGSIGWLAGEALDAGCDLRGINWLLQL